MHWLNSSPWSSTKFHSIYVYIHTFIYTYSNPPRRETHWKRTKPHAYNHSKPNRLQNGTEATPLLTWRTPISSARTRTCWIALASEKRSSGASTPRGLTNFMCTVKYTTQDINPYRIRSAKRTLNPLTSPELSFRIAMSPRFPRSLERERDLYDYTAREAIVSFCRSDFQKPLFELTSTLFCLPIWRQGKRIISFVLSYILWAIGPCY